MQSLHNPSRLSVMFDDDHAVANAGLALVGVLSEKLGLEELAEEMVSIAPFPVPRSPFPGRRAATLVHALVAGATCIDDADVLRSGCHLVGAESPGDGTLDARHVPAQLHVRTRRSSTTFPRRS